METYSRDRGDFLGCLREGLGLVEPACRYCLTMTIRCLFCAVGIDARKAEEETERFFDLVGGVVLSVGGCLVWVDGGGEQYSWYHAPAFA